MYAKRSVDLAIYRIDKADECLKEARDNLQIGNYGAAANRSYYAIFNAMRSMLNLEGDDYKKHSGVIAEFRMRYLKTGILPRSLSRIIRNLFDLRNSSDYDDFYVVSKDQVEKQTADAAVFIETVRECLMKRIESDLD